MFQDNGYYNITAITTLQLYNFYKLTIITSLQLLQCYNYYKITIITMLQLLQDYMVTNITRLQTLQILQILHLIPACCPCIYSLLEWALN